MRRGEAAARRVLRVARRRRAFPPGAGGSRVSGSLGDDDAFSSAARAQGHHLCVLSLRVQERAREGKSIQEGGSTPSYFVLL